MKVRQSRVLSKLKAGGVVHLASTLPEPWNVDLLGQLGFDGAWVDAEHNELNDANCSSLAMAGKAADIDVMVRIRKQGYADYFRFLEVGCTGILVPHCDSVADAAYAVEFAKFPPLGRRSLGGLGADCRYGMVPLPDYLAEANSQTFIAVQIECLAAVEAAHEIAAVEGVDVLFVGPGDLSLSLGKPGQTRHPEVVAAIRKVAQAARNNGKHWGLPVGSIADAQFFYDLGARFIIYGSAKGLLIKGFKQVRQEWEKAFHQSAI